MSSTRVKPAAPGGQPAPTREDLDAPAEGRARNAQILTAVLDRSHAVLLRQARKHAQLPDDAEEALQAACILFIERFDPRYRSLPWLQTTVKREAWRIAKRAHRRRELGITAAPRADGQGTADLTDAFPDPDADLFDLACRRQFARDSRSALERLTADQRAALLLLGLGYSYAEIAASCAWTLTKVNRCLSRGRARLRAIEAECESPPADRPTVDSTLS
jgi:RNA polymerase sigma factor (sigma-70 family)